MLLTAKVGIIREHRKRAPFSSRFCPRRDLKFPGKVVCDVLVTLCPVRSLLGANMMVAGY